MGPTNCSESWMSLSTPATTNLKPKAFVMAHTRLGFFERFCCSQASVNFRDTLAARLCGSSWNRSSFSSGRSFPSFMRGVTHEKKTLPRQPDCWDGQRSSSPGVSTDIHVVDGLLDVPVAPCVIVTPCSSGVRSSGVCSLEGAMFNVDEAELCSPVSHEMRSQ
uniref:Uncharacterized protein n=1 Tax=Hyaloperonospora arabidopsidis (strain Emoy2) TaxID=559515 RepID=M4B259_HYAAE